MFVLDANVPDSCFVNAKEIDMLFESGTGVTVKDTTFFYYKKHLIGIKMEAGQCVVSQCHYVRQNKYSVSMKPNMNLTVKEIIETFNTVDLC